MGTWKIDRFEKKPSLKNPVLVEGLPGIGNVGKVAVDLMVDNLKAKKYCDFFSYTLPHSVFVNEKNLVELPKISLYYKRLKKQDILILAGDMQPVDEVSSYEFCDAMLDVCQEFDCKEIVTLGGIGLQDIPKNPRVFCTANNEEIMKKYKKGTELQTSLYGIVGPIVGVSGLLVGMAKKRKIPSIALLAETYGHPMYLGVKGAREILKVLNIHLNLKMNLKSVDKEIDELEIELLKRAEQLGEISRQTALKRLKGKVSPDEATYIG